MKQVAYWRGPEPLPKNWNLRPMKKEGQASTKESRFQVLSEPVAQNWIQEWAPAMEAIPGHKTSVRCQLDFHGHAVCLRPLVVLPPI